MRLIRTLACAAAAALANVPGHAAINASGARRRVRRGPHLDQLQGVLVARHAHRAVALRRAAAGRPEKLKVVMTKGTGNLWSANVTTSALDRGGHQRHRLLRLPRVGPELDVQRGWTKGSGLGFVADVDAQGNRFNPNKLLMDPYARELSQDPTNPSNLDGTVYASGASYRLMDSGTVAPKGIVFVPDTQSVGTKPTRAFKDDVVYEVNVRGLTMSDTSIAAASRGTYKGAGLKAAWLASLGVTAVEFLPVQETQNDTNDVVPNTDAGDNYWGYSTLNWFAPDRRYSSDKTAGGPDQGVQGDGQGVPRRRDQGDAGRRLQPLGRRRRVVVHRHHHLQRRRATAAWTTRPTTSSPATTAVQLRQHRRRRQLQHLQPDRAEPDRRLARVLARHDGRRRLPLRPRRRAGQHLHRWAATTTTRPTRAPR